MKSYLVIGYANYTPKDRINYENSLKHFGYNYKIVGENQKWINFMESKIKSCYEYVKSLNRKPEIIICTDCFDVLAAQTCVPGAVPAVAVPAEGPGSRERPR